MAESLFSSKYNRGGCWEGTNVSLIVDGSQVGVARSVACTGQAAAKQYAAANQEDVGFIFVVDGQPNCRATIQRCTLFRTPAGIAAIESLSGSGYPTITLTARGINKTEILRLELVGCKLTGYDFSLDGAQQSVVQQDALTLLCSDINLENED